MPTAVYILVPKDGGLEKTLDAGQVKGLKLIDDVDMQVGLCERLQERGMSVPSFWPCDKGVLVFGTAEQARAVTSIMDDGANFKPRPAIETEVTPNAERPGISSAFKAVSGPYAHLSNVLRPSFATAANDASATPIKPALRQSVRGTTHLRAA